MADICEVIRTAIIDLGKTQYEVADKAWVTRSYYADVERVRYTPSLKLLSRLGAILNIYLNILKINDGNTSI